MTQFTLPGFDQPLNIMNQNFLPVNAGGVRDRRALQAISMAPQEIMDELAMMSDDIADDASDLLKSGDVKGMRARMAASEIMSGSPTVGMGGRGGMGVQVLEALEDLAQKDLHPRLLEAGFTPQDIPEGIGRDQMNDIMREVDGGTFKDKEKALKALKEMRGSTGRGFVPRNVPKAHQALIEAAGLATGKEAADLGRAIQVQIADDYAVRNTGLPGGRVTSAFNPGAGVGTGAPGSPAAIRGAASPRAGTVALSSMENAADMPLFQQAAQQQRAGRVAADAAAGRPVGPMPMGRSFAPNILPVEEAGDATKQLAQIESRMPRVGVGQPLTRNQIRSGLFAGSINPAALAGREGQALASMSPEILAQSGAPGGAPPPIAGRSPGTLLPSAPQSDDVALALAGEMQEGEKFGTGQADDGSPTGQSKPTAKTGKTPGVSRADKERAKRLQNRIDEIKNFKPNAAQVDELGLPKAAVGKKIFADTPDDAVLRIARSSIDSEDARAVRDARSLAQAREFGPTAGPRNVRGVTVNPEAMGGGGGGGRGRPKRVRLPVGDRPPEGDAPGGKGGGKGGVDSRQKPKRRFFDVLRSKAGRRQMGRSLVRGMGGKLGIAGLGIGALFLVSDAVARRNQRVQAIQGLQGGAAAQANFRLDRSMQLQGARQGASELQGLAALSELPRQVSQSEAELASLLGRSGAYAAQASAVSPQGMAMSQQRIGNMV